MHADKLASFVTAPILQLEGLAGLNLEAWESDRLRMPLAQYTSDFVVKSKRVGLDREMKVSQINSCTFDEREFTVVYEEGFESYIIEQLGRIQACYIEEIADNYFSIKLLEDNE